MILFGFEEVPPQILNIDEDDVKLDSVSVSFQRIHIFLLKKTIYVGNSTQKKNVVNNYVPSALCFSNNCN